MKKQLFLFLITSAAVCSEAQEMNNSSQLPTVNTYNVNRIEMHQTMTYNHVRQLINLPQIDHLQTLKCDFHIHTVFSDGNVWPTARVKEAWQTGLDVIAITEHTSEVPSKKDISGGPNRSFEIAKPLADQLGITLIQATEITKSKEDGGHLNALFITDAMDMVDKNGEEAVNAAVNQGAFILWNHPGWAIDTCKAFPVNEKLLKENKIHGVEVFNEAEWYPRALSWVKDYNIACIGTSDIHDLIHAQYRPTETRFVPMTLVFAQSNRPEHVKEALFARRTLAFFNGNIAGNPALLEKFFQASINVQLVSESQNEKKYLISNPTDIPFDLVFEGKNFVRLPSRSAIQHNTSLSTSGVNVHILNMHTYEFKTHSSIIHLDKK